MSLRLRLTLLIGLVLLLASGTSAGLVYVSQAEALRRDLDTSLRDQAREFNSTARVSFSLATRRLLVELPDPNAFAAASYFVQAVDESGNVVKQSRNLDPERLPVTEAMVQRALHGDEWFEDLSVDGQPLRAFMAPVRVAIPGERTLNVGLIQVGRPLQPTYAALRSLQTTLLAVTGVGVLTSLLASWLLARAALRPIDRLAATAHAIGSAQDFSRRVPVRPGGHRDEVGRLADEFNGMLARLQAAYEQLGVALAAQRRFVADASHELRTPLTSLRGNLDLLRQITVAQDDRRAAAVDQELLADMSGETERMSRLVADLLLLAQADAGQHLTLRPVALSPLLQEAFRTARFLRADVELRLGDLADEAWVLADPDRLKQLLLILLDNALKYTPAGGRVTLSARRDQRDGAEGVAVRVADTGRGIPREEQPRIFARFYRADGTRSGQGAGLGLAIARWIVDEHQGTIGLESEPGRGSVFTTWLPVCPAPTPRATATDATPAAAGERPHVLQPASR